MRRTAAEYHRLTSYERNRLPGGGLDWANMPGTAKHYEGYPAIALPREFDLPETSLAALYTAETDAAPPAGSLTASVLSTILFTAYGLTARRRAMGEEFFFRSAPSAGALYPSEIYLGAWEVEDIPPGLYHFNTIRHTLTRLREGDFRGTLGTGSIDAPPLEGTVTFYITGIFFRSSWKPM